MYSNAVYHDRICQQTSSMSLAALKFVSVITCGLYVAQQHFFGQNEWRLARNSMHLMGLKVFLNLVVDCNEGFPRTAGARNLG